VILRQEIEYMGPKTTSTLSHAPGSTGTSDSTGRLACAIEEKLSDLRRIEQEIKLIETAVNMLSAPKKLIIEVRYLTDDGTDKAARLTLRAHGKRNKWRTMHNVTYQKLRDEAIKEIAEMLGETETALIQE
jgi:hypothetical protein